MADETDPHGQLGGKGSRHHLGEGEPLRILLFRYPPPRYQVTLHVAGKGDGAAKAQGAEAEEVTHQLPKPHRLQGIRIAPGHLFPCIVHLISWNRSYPEPLSVRARA